MTASCNALTIESTTTPALPACASNSGYTRFMLNFRKYENVADVTADCSRCDSASAPGQDYCDLVFDICVSRLGQR